MLEIDNSLPFQIVQGILLFPIFFEMRKHLNYQDAELHIASHT